MTDDQDMGPVDGWQAPGLVLTVFAGDESYVGSEQREAGGIWVRFTGNGSVSTLNLCLEDMDTVKRVRDLLDEALK